MAVLIYNVFTSLNSFEIMANNALANLDSQKKSQRLYDSKTAVSIREDQMNSFEVITHTVSANQVAVGLLHMCELTRKKIPSEIL